MRGVWIGGGVFVAVVLAIIFASFIGWGNSALAPTGPTAAEIAQSRVTAFKGDAVSKAEAIRKVRTAPPAVIEAIAKLGLSDPAVLELLRRSHNPHALEFVRNQLNSELDTESADAIKAWPIVSGEKDHEDLAAIAGRTGKAETNIRGLRTDMDTACRDAKSARTDAETARRGVEEAVKTANEAAEAVKGIRTDLGKAKELMEQMVSSDRLRRETEALELRIRQEAEQREQLRLAVNDLAREMKFSEKYAELQNRVGTLKAELEATQLAKRELQESVGYMRWQLTAQEQTVARLTGELTASLANAAWLRRQVATANERARTACSTAGVIYTPVPLPVVYECPPPFIGFPGRRCR